MLLAGTYAGKNPRKLLVTKNINQGVIAMIKYVIRFEEEYVSNVIFDINSIRPIWQIDQERNPITMWFSCDKLTDHEISILENRPYIESVISANQEV